MTDRSLALVTGASSGIGFELARQFADHGFDLIVNAEDAGLSAAAQQLRGSGARVQEVQADLRSPDGVRAVWAAVEATGRPLAVAALNAGVGQGGAFVDNDLADEQEIIDTNITSTVRLAKLVLRDMNGRGEGRVLFTSSIAALTGGITGPHYAASKAGLHGLTHFLASRVAASGVTVNAIAPALIEETGMFPGDPRELIRKVPVGRLGTPRDVADLAVAVLRNGYLTNQVLSIDGGMHPR